jgi:sigma-B regulation protein RsbU (phosphoserine phosphatase)
MSESSFTAEERILLVDDNPLNLQVLRETLQSRQSKLLVAKNGETALSISRKTIPDLILLDIMMPGMDGYQVIAALKADTATADIPVIFLSALDQTVDKVRGFELGAVDYITKPFQAEEVLARVDTHLTIHRLKQEVERQKDQLEKELQTVSRVQRNLLPKGLPTLDGLELDAYYATSRYAGGDYYDVVALGDGRLGVLVADAEGHSTPAAVLMAMTCALFRSLRRLWDQPARLLAQMNHHLCKVAEPSFVTALYLLVDFPAGKVYMARAGHPPPMVFWGARGMAEEVKVPGVMMMGFDEYDRVPESDMPFEPGDLLLAYTDGLTERFGPGDQLYGEKRLLAILQDHGAASAHALGRAVVADLERFAEGRPADDDQAFVAVKHI